MSHYIYIAERSRRNIEKCHRQEKIACVVLSLFSLQSTFYSAVTTMAHTLRRKCACSTAGNMTFTFTFKILESSKPRDIWGKMVKLFKKQIYKDGQFMIKFSHQNTLTKKN